MTFKQIFFRLYDKKIAEGTISFCQTGISKEDFTRLCTEETYIPDRETLDRICKGMRLDDAERRALFEAAEKAASQN